MEATGFQPVEHSLLHAYNIDMKKLIFFSMIFISTEACIPFICRALDLDDGIEADDSIEEYHEMGKMQKNVNYIVRNAISKAYSGLDANKISIEDNEQSSKTASVSSIIVEEGSKVKGDIIIIDRSRGNKSAISR